LEEQGLTEQQEYHETQAAYMDQFSVQLNEITDRLEIISEQLEQYEDNSVSEKESNSPEAADK